MLFIKISFFIIFLDIFRCMRWMKICSYVGMILTSATYLAAIIGAFILSTPRPGQTWAQQAMGDDQGHNMVLAVAQAALGVAVSISTF